MSGGNAINNDVYTIHNHVKLIHGGAEYFSKMVEMINAASISIHLQTYIYDDDETGNIIADALIRATGREVKVYMLLDAFASQNLSNHFKYRLIKAGVHLCFYEPFFHSKNFYIGRRLHHKVIVTDLFNSMVGGVNVSNRYNDINGTPAWLDWAVYTEGDASRQLYDYCVEIWNKATKQTIRLRDINHYSIHKITDICYVRVRKNDWVNRYTQVSNSYKELFKTAKSSIVVMSSYFWPSRNLLRKIAYASKRGVDIKLILAGVSDVKIAKHAERYMYRWLFRNNVAVYEYQRNVLHGKIAVKDNKWVTLGSYNLNNISAYASIELNMDVKNDVFAQTARNALEQIIINDCLQVTNNTSIPKTLFHQFVQFLSYEIIHLIFFLFTFYFRQTKYER
ncbi:MAG: phospholipase D-like domain-containing protein [Flavipsychrobacter sp.]